MAVDGRVATELACCDKALLTNLAHVNPVRSVLEPVELEAGELGEVLVTQVADKGLLPSVGHTVALQVHWIGKPFVADVACQLFG